jgi:hypothetical protein
LADVGVAGQVHGDHGDNYGGWNAASYWYVAPVPGWYLVVAEVTVGVNTSATRPSVLCLIQISTGPAVDYYEYHGVGTTDDGTVPGATALGYYYLRAGDYIWPLILFSGYPENGETVVSAGHHSHMEVIFVSS